MQISPPLSSAFGCGSCGLRWSFQSLHRWSGFHRIRCRNWIGMQVVTLIGTPFVSKSKKVLAGCSSSWKNAPRGPSTRKCHAPGRYVDWRRNRTSVISVFARVCGPFGSVRADRGWYPQRRVRGGLRFELVNHLCSWVSGSSARPLTKFALPLVCDLTSGFDSRPRALQLVSE